MCGRFTLKTPLAKVMEQFDVQASAGRQGVLFEPRFNIAPTQHVLVVRREPALPARELTVMRWGLVPSWSKGSPTGAPLINARSESLAEKASFRNAYRLRRCLIPGDGFYEWQQAGSKKKPFYIHRPDHRPFAFAGIWERCEGGPIAESCTIVTTHANDYLRMFHDRMPVILSPNDYVLWLDPNVEEPARLQHLLAPYGDELIAEPVSTRVNKVANDDPQCVEVLAENQDESGERLLF